MLIKTKASGQEEVDVDRTKLLNNTSITNSEFQLTVIYWNIEGLKSKIKLFYNDLIQTNPCIVYLSETWHEDPIVLHRLYPSYNVYTVSGFKVKTKGRLMMGSVLTIRKDIDCYCKIVETSSEL